MMRSRLLGVVLVGSLGAVGGAGELPALVQIPSGVYDVGLQAPPGNAHFGDRYTLVNNRYAIDAFAVGKYELSNAEFCDLMNWGLQNKRLRLGEGGVMYGDLVVLDLRSGGADIEARGEKLVVKDGRGNYPVVEVTWHGAMVYCALLNEREKLPQAVDLKNWTIDVDKHGYRLPTEVEWYVVVQGSKEPEHHQKDSDALKRGRGSWAGMTANVDRDTYHTTDNRGNKPTGTQPCGSLPPQNFDAHDLIGNVWEWCADNYVGVGVIAYQTNSRAWQTSKENYQDWKLNPGWDEIPKNPVFDEAHRAALQQYFPFKPVNFGPAWQKPGGAFPIDTGARVNVGGSWSGLGGYRWAEESFWHRRDDRPELSTDDLGFRVVKGGSLSK